MFLYQASGTVERVSTARGHFAVLMVLAASSRGSKRPDAFDCRSVGTPSLRKPPDVDIPKAPYCRRVDESGQPAASLNLLHGCCDSYVSWTRSTDIEQLSRWRVGGQP
jgi:hypothetical protein